MMRLPEDFVVKAKERNTDKEIELSARQIYDDMHDTDDLDYPPREKEEKAKTENGGKSDWKSVKLAENLKIAQYEKSTLIGTEKQSKANSRECGKLASHRKRSGGNCKTQGY